MTPSRPAPADHDSPPPGCAAALDLLQRQLDGDGPDPTPEVEAHLHECASCRGRFLAARDLQIALALAAPVQPTPLQTDRILLAVQRDWHRQRRRRWLRAGALAAAAVLAVWLAWPRPQVPTPAPPAPQSPDIVQQAPAPEPPPLRQSVTAAGEAMVALTRRAAQTAVGEGRLVLPPVAVPPDLTAAAKDALDPAARPLGDAGQALANGFEPVATSARRAVTLFWRDLPPLSDVRE